MKVRKNTISLIVWLAFMHFVALQHIVSQNIRFGVYNNSPKVFLDKNGKAQGIFIDVFEYIAEKEGWQYEYVFGTWNEHLQNIQNGLIDILPDVAFDSFRDSILSFNKIPVLQSWVQLYSKNYISLSRIEDLGGLRIGVLKGSVQQDYMQNIIIPEFKIDVELINFDDYQLCVQALLEDSIDGILGSRFFYFSDLRPDNVRPTPIIFGTGDLYFATAKGKNVDLLEKIDAHLYQMKNDPHSEYYEILEKWLHPYTTRSFFKTLLWILLISGFITLHFFVIFYILRQRVKMKTLELTELNKKLEAQERNYREIFNNTKDAIFIHEVHTGKIIDVNETTVKMYGYNSKEEALAYFSDDRFIKNLEYTNQRAFEKIQEACKTGSLNFEWLAQKKDGTEFWVEVNLLRTNIAGIDRVLAFVTDIDSRKKIEFEQVKAHALFQRLAENAPVGIFRTNKNGETIYVNPAWTSMTGVSAEEAYGYGWSKLIHPEERDFLLSQWREKLAKREISKAEYRIIRKDGSIVWVLGIAVPDFSENEFQGYVGTMTDISMVKEAEMEILKKNEELLIAKEKAEESDRLKSSFLANLSHEIRTPMNAIAGFASLLNNPEIDREKIIKYSSIIQKSTQQLLTIINDIIDISMIETRQMKLRFENLHLGEFFDQLMTVFQSLLPNNQKLEFKYSIEESIVNCCITTDRVKLEQILTNLFSNAVKYTMQGFISISVERYSDNEIIFKVEDTGIGIPPHEHDKVFERFYRCNNDYTNAMKGSGLGLAIAKALVEMLGGKIWLSSESGKGTVFYVTHPFENKTNSNDELIKADTQCKNCTKPQAKILIVEDDTVNVLFLKLALADFEFQLLNTGNVQEAIELFRNHNDIRLILMDIKLEGGSGLDLTKLMKQEKPHIPIIVQSAYAMEEDKRKAMNAGADDFIAKPIGLNVLRDMISKYL